MPDAKSPSGPGKPITERRDAAVEREELEEMDSAADDAGGDPTRGPRTAERDAHVSGGNDNSAPKGGR